jgi:hypothetical protein
MSEVQAGQKGYEMPRCIRSTVVHDQAALP